MWVLGLALTTIVVSSLFFFTPILLLTMLVPIIVFFLFYPAWASSMGAPHDPLVKESGRQQRYLLRGEWRRHLEDTGRPSLLLLLGIARGHGSARAHSGGARSRSRYTSRIMWSRICSRFLHHCFRLGDFVGCFV